MVGKRTEFRQRFDQIFGTLAFFFSFHHGVAIEHSGEYGDR